MTHGLSPVRGAPTARPMVGRYLGLARSAAEQTTEALVLVSERHERDYEVARGTSLLAAWVRQDIESLGPLEKRYAAPGNEHPQKVRSALLGGTRIGGAGLLADLADLSILFEQMLTTWTILFQGSKELHDTELGETASAARAHTERGIRWLRTQIEHTAPETLAVGLDAKDELLASLPKGPDRISSIPDPIWAPIVSAVLVAGAGAVGLLVGRPWLLPSLGPTAVLVGEMPGHPASRPWNTLVGHLGGLAAGFLAVALVGAASQPSVLTDHVLTQPRVVASLLAIALTVLLGALLRASHPPAAATTLLVSLGGIRTAVDAANLIGGVIVLTVLGELFRYVRVHRIAPAERRAPKDSAIGRFIRRGIV